MFLALFALFFDLFLCVRALITLFTSYPLSLHSFERSPRRSREPSLPSLFSLVSFGRSLTSFCSNIVSGEKRGGG